MMFRQCALLAVLLFACMNRETDRYQWNLSHAEVTLNRRCLDLTSSRSFDLSRTQQLARLPDYRRKMAKSKYP
jgi:hypothetical protein